MSKKDIHQIVKEEYAALVKKNGAGSCCGSASCCSPSDMKGNLVKLAGYEGEDLQNLPAHAVEHSFGCGDPLAFSGVKPGQTVVDIGSGAGIDCFIASEKVGPKGAVIGIDMTPAMLEAARQNASQGGYKNVTFREGMAESMPLEDNQADWIISNCVINLSPDKTAVFREIFRVLKPGGQFSISDIVLGDALPEVVAQSVAAWTGCVAGAISEQAYIDGLTAAGLKEVTVQSRIVYDEATIASLIAGDPKAEDYESLARSLGGKIWSAKITGRK